MKTQHILEEIKENWQLEAKQENNQRYFYNIDEVNQILNGNKFYVIGRKGSGKSAISEHLSKIKDYRTFTEKLSFKHFPFNELYNLENNRYTPPQSIHNYLEVHYLFHDL